MAYFLSKTIYPLLVLFLVQVVSAKVTVSPMSASGEATATQYCQDDPSKEQYTCGVVTPAEALNACDTEWELKRTEASQGAPILGCWKEMDGSLKWRELHFCDYWWDNNNGAAAACKAMGYDTGHQETLSSSYYFQEDALFIGKCSSAENWYECSTPGGDLPYVGRGGGQKGDSCNRDIVCS